MNTDLYTFIEAVCRRVQFSGRPELSVADSDTVMAVIVKQHIIQFTMLEHNVVDITITSPEGGIYEFDKSISTDDANVGQAADLIRAILPRDLWCELA